MCMIVIIIVLIQVDLILFIQYLFCSEICLNDFQPFSIVRSLKTDVYNRADTILSGEKMHKMFFLCLSEVCSEGLQYETFQRQVFRFTFLSWQTQLCFSSHLIQILIWSGLVSTCERISHNIPEELFCTCNVHGTVTSQNAINICLSSLDKWP